MSVRLAGNPQGRGRSPGEERRGAGAREKLEKAIREAVEKTSGREVPEVGVRVTAMRGPSDEAAWVAVWVDFDDVVVISGIPGELEVAHVYASAKDIMHEVALSTINSPPFIRTPSTWRPSPSLSLLPAAFNTVLSLLGTEEVLDRELGVRLRAMGVSVRRMCDAYDAYCAPVVLVDFDVNGRKLTLSDLEVKLGHEGDTWRAYISCVALLRHGDRKLARRLYMLAWLREALENALSRLEEKGYSYEEVYFDDKRTYVFRVGAGDKEVEVELPYIPVFFDEEHILSRIWIPHCRSDEASLAEKMMREGVRELEEVDRRSREGLVELVGKARQLLFSDDPRLRDLGFLLALLIKRSYEEGEMAIPG